MPPDRLTYTAIALDRAAHLRADAAWLEAQLREGRARVVPVWRARNLVRALDAPAAILLDCAAAQALLARAEFQAFLGLVDGVPHFAVDISALDAPEESLPEPGVFEDLRNVGALLDHDEGALLAYARGLFSWHRRHLYCGACGSPTESAQAGHVRRCANADCATDHFPRLDPAVIVLVHDDDGRCLLGHGARIPAGMYSTLAGFVEPGESLEDAVAREIREEAGVEVADISYRGSQPWPFPSSLMLGFHAVAATTELGGLDDELEDVQWFDRAAVRAAAAGEGAFRLPRADSIARRLIIDWLESG